MPPTLRRRTALLTVAALTLAMLAAPAAVAQQGAPVHMSDVSFYNSVPHDLLLGHSYRVLVVVMNNGSGTAGVTVILNFPQDFYFTIGPAISFNLLPGDTKTVNFSLVPTNTNPAPTRVTAILIASEGGVQHVQTLTAVVNSISRDPGVYAWGSLIVVAVVVVMGVVAAAALLRRSRHGQRQLEIASSGAMYKILL